MKKSSKIFSLRIVWQEMFVPDEYEETFQIKTFFFAIAYVCNILKA